MCGIAGIVALDGFDPKLLVSMTQLIEYRGPDGFGLAFFPHGENARGEVFHQEVRLPSFARPKLGLGNRRLAILDLSELGNQPMQAEDGALSITFNGEIYNYLEVRKELEALGHSFKTNTDTEVILHAYREWGVECLKLFNGMWAFALWDRPRQRLFCARDRFGEKPFYYHLGTRSLIFGSEIKQILVCPEVRREANDSTVFAYLEHGLQDHTAETFFKGIFQLPAASFMTVDLGGESIVPVIRPYWELAVKPTEFSDDDACDEFLAKFTKAVAIRMRSDVPVGSCLSGGLDSSSIVCVARKVAPDHNFHTFSSCSEDKAFDEREYLSEVVRATHTNSHLVFPSSDDLWATLQRLIWHQDEPFGDCSVFAQWCVMQRARQESIPVLLDGQGGDETLCGYLKFYYFYLWHLLKTGNPRFLPEALERMGKDGGFLSAWTGAQRYLPGFLRGTSTLSARVCRPEYRREHHNGAPKLGAGVDLAHRQKADLMLYSVPALLHYEDRNSMAHSVESRVPFLDYELGEFLVNCPARLKLRQGWSKWILRESLKGILPEKVRLRRDKMWFASPQSRWITKDLRPGIERTFSRPELRMSRFLEPKSVAAEFNKFFAGSAGSLSHAALFRVLSLELWATVFDVS
jgi:asparagine synthase (glutamine-hydrolysing)